MKASYQATRRSLLGGLLGATLLGTAQASTIYDSGGFESPVFLTEQPLDGQDPVLVGNGPWAQDNGGSTAIVSAINPMDGTKSVKITRAAGSGADTRWGVVKPTSPAGLDNVVEVSFEMKVVEQPTEYGPLFGIEAYDESSGTPKLIGSLFHDAGNGELVFQQAGTGQFVGTGHFPDLVLHHHYSLAMNFSAKTYSLYADGKLIHTEGFVDPSAESFTDAPLATVWPGGVEAEGLAYIDNYLIEQTTSQVPYLTWQGDDTANVWDLGTTANWFDGIAPVEFASGDEVRFGDGGSASPAIQLQGSLAPSAVLVSASQDYELAGSGSIDGATGLTKDGSGTLILSNANGYTGDTTVDDGELSVRNGSDSATGSGTVTIMPTSVLSGNGAIGGPVEVAYGGVVSPGVGVGTLTLADSLVLDDAALEFELGGSNDQIAVAGDLTLAGTLKVTDAGGFGPGSYTLISYGGTLTEGTLVVTEAPSGYDYTIDTSAAGIVALLVTPPPPAPAAPDTLAAAPAGTNEISLTWNDQSSTESRFLIERSPDGLDYRVVGYVDADTTSYLDTGLSSGATYSYRVYADNTSGASGYSNVATATTNLSPPVAYLRFDESSGTVAYDSSPNGNDGTLAGAPLYTTGQIGNAIDLDGVDDHVLLPTGVVSDVNDFTIATWVKLDTLDTWSRVFDFGADTNTYMFLTPRNSYNGKVRFAITTSSGGGEQIIEGPSALPTGQWTHVAITRKGNIGTLYVDGVEVGSNAGLQLTPSAMGATANNFIGRSQYADPYLNGQIDEFLILDRALAASDVAALADLTAPEAPTGVVVTEGDGEVSLSWDTVSGATSYSVYRSTGNGYTLVASDLTSASFTDDTVQNGVTYSYVITASNGSSESVFSAVSSAAPMPDATYGGQAVVASITVLGVELPVGDSGSLPEDGGTLENSLLTLDEQGVIAGEIGHVFTIGQAGRTRSEAMVADLSINAEGVLIEADFLMARALAAYQGPGDTGVAGGSEIGNLDIAGTPVLITGETNQIVSLPNGQLIIDEQVETEFGITVNALRISLFSGADIIVASAYASYETESIEEPPAIGDDQVSGGGWIADANGDKIGNFSLSGGYEDGVLFGDLNFKDKATGMKVKATSVTAYGYGPTANSRQLEGTCEIDGTDGYTFVAIAEDNGEPGDADTFSLDLSNGYHADGVLGGGNIQVHVPGE